MAPARRALFRLKGTSFFDHAKLIAINPLEVYKKKKNTDTHYTQQLLDFREAEQKQTCTYRHRCKSERLASNIYECGTNERLVGYFFPPCATSGRESDSEVM